MIMNNNKIDVVAFRKSVEKLPYWLRHAAIRIEEAALKSGEKSVLAIKLNWYADKIEKATVNPSDAAPQTKEYVNDGPICSCGGGENKGHNWNCPWQEDDEPYG